VSSLCQDIATAGGVLDGGIVAGMFALDHYMNLQIVTPPRWLTRSGAKALTVNTASVILPRSLDPR
jgi:hypothetical protein